MSSLKIVSKSIAFLLIVCFSVSCKTKLESEPTTTEEIIERHINKVGINLLGSSIKTLTLVSEATYEDQSSVITTSRFEFPYKLHQNELYGGAIQDYKLSHEKGFSIKNNIQIKTLDSIGVINLKENAHLMTFYRWQERHWKYEYKGKETIDNQEHFVLEGINDSIRLGNRVLINASTFLIKRIQVKNTTFNASSDFSGYFTKDGLTYPNETITDFGTYNVTSKVSSFTINPTFDSSIFEIKTAQE